MTTDAARKAVFNTPELLENIISFVPPTEIRTKVQRLSRQWKEAVDSSPAIKGKLWTMFPNTTALQPRYITDEHLKLPVLPSSKLGIPVYSHAVTFNQVLFEDSVGSLKIRLDQDPHPGLLRKVNGDLVNVKAVDFLSCKAVGRPDSPAQMLRSSWRDMYLTNPPITTAVLCATNYWDYEGEFGPKVIRFSVRDHDGLTLGLLYDTFMAGLPWQVDERFGSAVQYSMGSLDVALGQLEMGTTAH
jgi:hypothetical protein